MAREGAAATHRSAAVAPRLGVGVVLFLIALLGGPGCGSDDPLLLADSSNVSGATGVIEGTITSGGVPVPGASLSLDPPGPTTASDGAGRFRLEGVPSGVVTLIVAASGRITNFERVVVLANRTSTADVDLRVASGTGVLRGEVTDGQFGLEDVTVSTVPVTLTPVTTSDGRYTFPGLTPGQYQVRARRLGYDEVTRVVQVQEGRTTVQDFALARRTDGVLQGVVLDSAGSPIPDQAVDLLFEGRTFTAFTNSLGQYQFFNLTTGFYVLSVQADGFLPGGKGLEVRGGAVGNGDVVLYGAGTPSPVPGSITGTIFDPRDAPVAGITVTLSVGAVPGSVITGADGAFTFVDVPTGSVVVTATQTAPPVNGPQFATEMRTVLVGTGLTADGSMNLTEL